MRKNLYLAFDVTLLVLPQLVRALLVEQVLAQLSRFDELLLEIMYGFEFVLELSYWTDFPVSSVHQELRLLVVNAVVLDFSLTQVDPNPFLRA